MFKIPPTQKQIKKYCVNQSNSINIPTNWADFARMTKIRSGGKIVVFEPYPYQQELVQVMLERSLVVVKSRQVGISEVLTSFMLWRAASNPGYLGVVFSKTQQDTSLLARRMRRMIDSVGLQTTTDNLQDLELVTGGRILFRNSKPESGRSLESVCDVFYDEAAFVEDLKAIRDSLTPAMQMLGDNAREYVISTPNGKTGLYWELLSEGNGGKDIELTCNQVSKGESEPFQWWIDSGGWAKVLIHWKVHPIYGSDSNFLQSVHERLKLSWATIQQEYNLNFQESSVNYFSADIVRKGAIGEYEERLPKTFYFIGIDASTTGEDYAVCAVLKLVNGIFSLVNLYRKRNQTSEYHLYHMGEIIKKYDPISVGVEVTGGTGQVWFEQLSKSHPFNKFLRLQTTGDSKPAMLDRVKLLLEKGSLIYPYHSPFVDELLSFKRQGKKLEAAQGKHDDTVMGVSFALKVAEEYL